MKKIPNEGSQTFEQFSQWGCAIFILGDIQNAAGVGPEQPDLS